MENLTSLEQILTLNGVKIETMQRSKVILKLIFFYQRSSLVNKKIKAYAISFKIASKVVASLTFEYFPKLLNNNRARIAGPSMRV